MQVTSAERNVYTTTRQSTVELCYEYSCIRERKRCEFRMGSSIVIHYVILLKPPTRKRERERHSQSSSFALLYLHEWGSNKLLLLPSTKSQWSDASIYRMEEKIKKRTNVRKFSSAFFQVTNILVRQALLCSKIGALDVYTPWDVSVESLI